MIWKPEQQKMTSHSTNHRIGVLESEIIEMLQGALLDNDPFINYFFGRLLGNFSELSDLRNAEIAGLERRINELQMEIVFKDA